MACSWSTLNIQWNGIRLQSKGKGKLNRTCVLSFKTQFVRFSWMNKKISDDDFFFNEMICNFDSDHCTMSLTEAIRPCALDEKRQALIKVKKKKEWIDETTQLQNGIPL